MTRNRFDLNQAKIDGRVKPLSRAFPGSLALCSCPGFRHAEAYSKRAKTMRKRAEPVTHTAEPLFLRLAEYYERMAGEVEKNKAVPMGRL